MGHFWDGGTLSFPPRDTLGGVGHFRFSLGGTSPRTPVSGGTDATHLVGGLVPYQSIHAVKEIDAVELLSPTNVLVKPKQRHDECTVGPRASLLR